MKMGLGRFVASPHLHSCMVKGIVKLTID